MAGNPNKAESSEINCEKNNKPLETGNLRHLKHTGRGVDPARPFGAFRRQCLPQKLL